VGSDGDVLQYNALLNAWEAVPFSGAVQSIGVIVGDGSAVSPIRLADGNLGDEQMLAWDGAQWNVENRVDWRIDGNSNINPAIHFLGTTTPQPVAFRTDNVEAMRITDDQRLGVGTSTPGRKLAVQGTGATNGGVQVNVQWNNAPNLAIANLIETNYAGYIGSNGGVIDNVKIFNNSSSNGGNTNFQNRALWAEARSDARLNLASYGISTYNGANTNRAILGAEPIIAAGMIGRAAGVNTTLAYQGVGVAGVADSLQQGDNYGVLGGAKDAAGQNIGVGGSAHLEFDDALAYYNALPADFSSGLIAVNDRSNSNDYGLYVDASKSYFSGNVGVGTQTPNRTLHVEGASGVTVNVTLNNPPNTNRANDFVVNYSNYTGSFGGVLDNARFLNLTSSGGLTAYQVRGLWAEARSDAQFNTGSYGIGTYAGANTSRANLSTVPIISVGVIGRAASVNPSLAYGGVGVAGVADSLQQGNNYGVLGGAKDAAGHNIGIGGSAHMTLLDAFNYYNTLPVDFSAGVIARNIESGENDWGIYVDAARNFIAGSQHHSVRTLGVDAAAGVGDYIVLVNANAGNVTYTLPDAAGNSGRVLKVKRTDSSANTLTVSSAGGQIDGAATANLAGLNVVTVVSDGSDWYIIGN
jgi:hypothetical protein